MIFKTKQITLKLNKFTIKNNNWHKVIFYRLFLSFIAYHQRWWYCNNCGTIRLGYPCVKNVDGRSFSEKFYFTVPKSGLKIMAVLYNYNSKNRVVGIASYLWSTDFFGWVYVSIFKIYIELIIKNNSPITLI